MAEIKIQRRDYLLLALLFLCACLLLGRIAYIYIADMSRYPIRTVKITGHFQSISKEKIAAKFNEYLPHHSFFTLPIQTIQRELATWPWVHQAAIARVWPDTITVKLTEEMPIAIWNHTILTQSGKILYSGSPEDTRQSLPILFGPEDQAQEVLHVYQKISKILANYNLYAKSIQKRNNQAWEVTLTPDVILRLGKQDLEARVIRFCKAYPAVFAKKLEQVASIDLRYQQGMAVQWKNK